MTQALRFLLEVGRPLTSPFLALLVLGALNARGGSRWRPSARAALIGAAVLVFWVVHGVACLSGRVSDWLAGTESPLVAVFLVIVLPAMYLPRGRGYRLFLAVPATVLLLALVDLWQNMRGVPRGEWAWFPIRPVWLMGGIASLLVLIQPLLALRHFRTAVRLTCFLVLTYGGCALRSSYDDYKDTVRRRNSLTTTGVITATVPALRNDRRMTYLPSAPCRFTADGGYVQGCNMELAQRVMQVNWLDGNKRVDAIGNTELLLGALLFFLIVSFILARWFCGWLCPLSFMGDLLDRIRRLLRLPHLKPARPLKLAYVFSGGGLAGLTLLMAKLQPHVDERTGAILGCRIPAYPFCKICPSQPVCSVIGRAAPEYAPVPGTDLTFGFFTTFYIVLLVVFLLSFAMGRRLWCRMCPMGMISGVFNRGGLMKLRGDGPRRRLQLRLRAVPEVRREVPARQLPGAGARGDHGDRVALHRRELRRPHLNHQDTKTPRGAWIAAIASCRHRAHTRGSGDSWCLGVLVVRGTPHG
ncbi:MAG: 4Fe-4S binding protein [Planctomycetota bacterium]